MDIIEHRMTVHPQMSWMKNPAELSTRIPVQKYRVICECGWKGPLRFTPKEAEDVIAHAGGFIRGGVQLGAAV